MVGFKDLEVGEDCRCDRHTLWAARAAGMLLQHEMKAFARDQRGNEGAAPSHAAWLLEQVRLGKVTGHKAHRWLAYAQGIIVVHGLSTLEEMKYLNMMAKKSVRPPGDQGPVGGR